MLEAVPDIVIGSVFFITLVVVAVLAGNLLQRAAKSRNRRALASLAPIIDGSPQSDHKSGWLHGQYKGQAVHITMIPGKNIGQSSETTRRINAFELVFEGIEGGLDWQVAREGLLRKQWVASAPDEHLRDRLAETDLASRLESVGTNPLLRYNARQKALVLHEDVKPRLAPKPDQFHAQLEFMIHAARINSELNPPSR